MRRSRGSPGKAQGDSRMIEARRYQRYAFNNDADSAADIKVFLEGELVRLINFSVANLTVLSEIPFSLGGIHFCVDLGSREDRPDGQCCAGETGGIHVAYRDRLDGNLQVGCTSEGIGWSHPLPPELLCQKRFLIVCTEEIFGSRSSGKRRRRRFSIRRSQTNLSNDQKGESYAESTGDHH